ncbi:hypothetical protein Sbs19_08680 [Sphingobium sp. BS19]|nr:hypothetical protein Sbs19_08680 [Sphingobium sp. BS19]
MIRTGIEYIRINQHAVGLHTDAAGVTQLRPQLSEQCCKLTGTHEQRLAAMQYDGERSALRMQKISKVGAYAGLDFSAQPLRLISPTVVTHVIDVAVAAIQVAAARDLEEDSVDVHRPEPFAYRL